MIKNVKINSDNKYDVEVMEKPKISNIAWHARRIAGIYMLSFAAIEIVCCVYMPFLIMPAGILGLVNTASGISHFIPYFDIDLQQVQNKFSCIQEFCKTLKGVILVAFGLDLCFGVPIFAPITELLSTFWAPCAWTIKIGFVSIGGSIIISRKPQLLRNLWIYFKNGIISLIPGIYPGSFGKAIAISRQEIEHINEYDTAEGFDIGTAVKTIESESPDSDDKKYHDESDDLLSLND